MVFSNVCLEIKKIYRCKTTMKMKSHKNKENPMKKNNKFYEGNL